MGARKLLASLSLDLQRNRHTSPRSIVLAGSMESNFRRSGLSTQEKEDFAERVLH